MYEAVPGAARAWRALFTRVFAEAGVAIEVVEHCWPEPIAALWAKPDLGCAFMCGWPFVRSGRMQAIATFAPSPAHYEGLPRYRSEFLVREASGWTRLEEAFGKRFGWMSTDSQSGFNAPRAMLANHVSPARPALFSEVHGPLGAPASTLQALREGRVDCVALDGFWLDLVRRHEPVMLAGIRCVATTAWAPMPLLVAAPAIEPAIVERLRAQLLGLHARPGHAPLLADALVARFVEPDVAAYGALEAMARYATERGYELIR